MTDKQEGKSGSGWSLWKIAGVLFIALIFVSTAQQLGLLAKIGLNLGPVQFELQGTQAAAAPQTANGSTASPIVNSSQPAAVNQSGTTCPQRPHWGVLPYPYTWWGPFGDGRSFVYYVPFGAFWTWDPIHGYVEFTYSNESNPIPRDQWIRLANSGINVCVDSANYVFAAVD